MSDVTMFDTSIHKSIDKLEALNRTYLHKKIITLERELTKRDERINILIKDKNNLDLSNIRLEQELVIEQSRNQISHRHTCHDQIEENTQLRKQNNILQMQLSKLEENRPQCFLTVKVLEHTLVEERQDREVELIESKKEIQCMQQIIYDLETQLNHTKILLDDCTLELNKFKESLCNEKEEHERHLKYVQQDFRQKLDTFIRENSKQNNSSVSNYRKNTVDYQFVQQQCMGNEINKFCKQPIDISQPNSRNNNTFILKTGQLEDLQKHEVVTLTEKNGLHETVNEKQQIEMKDLRTKIDDLQNKLNTVEVENEKYRTQIKNIQEKYDSTKRKVMEEKTASQDMLKLKGDLCEKENQLRDYELANNELKNKNVIVKNKLTEMEKNQEKEKQTFVNKLATAKSQVKQLKNAIWVMEEDLKKEKKKYTNLEETKSKVNTSNNEEIKIFQKDVETQTSKHYQLCQDCEQRKRAAEEYHETISILNTILREHKGKLDELQRHEKQLQNEISKKDEQLKQENKKYSEETCRMKTELEQQQQEKSKYHEQTLNYRELFQSYEETKREIQQYKHTMQAQNGHFQMNLAKAQEEIDILKQRRKQDIADRDKNIADLSSRLAMEMSSKISSDERSLENVSIKNRPMNVASEYEMVCSNEWHDAKSSLDTSCSQISEEDKIKFLLSVFELSQTTTSLQLKLMKDYLGHIVSQPLEKLYDVNLATYDSIPTQIEVLIGDHLRNNADVVNTANIMKEVKRTLEQKCPYIPSILLDENCILAYMKASLRLAWKMILQRPPMCFKQDGIGEKWQGENTQEVFWSSSDPTNPKSRVNYYVHPSLYHGEALMVKELIYGIS